MSQPSTAPVRPDTFPLLAKILDGGLAGIIGVVCVFPLDLVKTRLQNQQVGPNGERMYSSILDCFKKTIKQEGFFGMYRGSAVNMILVTPEKAIKFAANDYCRFHLTTPDGHLSLSRQSLSGAVAGIFQMVISTPMELLKIQMQTAALAKQSGVAEVPTTTKVVVNLFKEKGIFGFYRGMLPTALRDVTFAAMYFPLMATLNSYGPRRKDGSGNAVSWVSLLAGLGAGAVCALLCTPLDVVKTRLQAGKTRAGQIEFNGFADCVIKTYKSEGWIAFFKGGLCRIIVLAPLNAIIQVVYFLEFGKKVLEFFH